MPTYRRRTTRVCRRPSHRRGRRMRGRGFMDFISKAGDFLKKSKLISTVGSALGAAGIPFASQIGSVAGSLGFGRRRHRRGHGLHLAGGSMSRPHFALRMR